MVDYSAPCFERWWMLLSSQSHSKTLSWSKRKTSNITETEVSLHIYEWITHEFNNQESLKRCFTTTVCVNYFHRAIHRGHIPPPQVINNDSTLLQTQHHKCSVISCMTLASFVLPKLGPHAACAVAFIVFSWCCIAKCHVFSTTRYM